MSEKPTIGDEWDVHGEVFKVKSITDGGNVVLRAVSDGGDEMLTFIPMAAFVSDDLIVKVEKGGP